MSKLDQFQVGPKGFRITFNNGWAVSVQFGVMNYCQRYTLLTGKIPDINSPEYQRVEVSCVDAETALISPEGKLIALKEGEDTVQGYQSPKQVLELLQLAAKKH